MSTQTRSGGGGGGRNKSKANKENKENAGTDDPQQQKAINASNNSGGGVEKQKQKGTDKSGSKNDSIDAKDKQHQQTGTNAIKTKQPTAEQIRIAQITDIKSGMDDPKIQEKIQKVMETTQRSEEDVCCALQECDNDMDRAVNFLMEILPVGAFATTCKKKKTKSQNKDQNDAGTGDGDWDNAGSNAGSGLGGSANVDPRDRRGARGGNSQRSGGGGGPGSGRGGRGNLRDGDRGGPRGPRGRDGDRGGPGRGSYGGGSRGGRGGGPRVGTRGPGSRDQNRAPRIDHQEIDAWDPVSSCNANDLNKPEESSAFADTWGDWDNEEYTGSLSDTKVFTPSSQAAGAPQTLQQQQPPQPGASTLSSQSQPSSQSQQQVQPQPSQPVVTPASGSTSVTNPTELSAPPGLEQQILNPPQPKETDLVQQYSTTVVSSTATAAAAASNTVQYADLHSAPSVATQHLRQALDMPQINSSSSLSAEQSQYFNTLSSQNSNLQTSGVNSYQPSSVQYPTTYGSSNSFTDPVTSSQQAPAVRRQRARVPPPSKIPSSAVEMPGDNLNSIGFLDVQFGGLDFGTDDTLDTVLVTDKFNANSLEQNSSASVQPASVVQPTQPEVSDFQSKSSVVNNLQPKPNLSTSLQSSQILPGPADSLSATQSDSLSNSYSQRSSSTVVPSSVSTGVNVNSINSTSSTLEQLTKTDPYSQSTGANAGPGGYQNVSYSTSSQANKTSYPSSAAPQGYNNSNYSSSQVSTNTYPAATNNYSSYNQSGVNSFQQPSSNVSNTVVPNNNSTSSVGVSTVNQSNPNLPVNNNNVSNNSSNTNTGYLSSQYPVSQTSSAFPSQQSYQNSSQSVYGNTGLSSNTGYSGNTSTSSGQFSNFSSSKLKDTPVSTQFESFLSSVASSTVSNNNNNTANNSVSSSSSSLPNSSVVSTTSISSPSLGLTNTKVSTNSTAKSSSSSSGTGVVPNIPMVSPYIQPGVPFYQQPVYSYEDLQMIQQRMSHVPGYYDMNYQTPTSLGAAGVRDANLGSVAYSTMSDGRFTRTDNNSSPVSNVPSTMSQQTGSGGPMLNLPYAYFYGGNMMPGGFQYGTPAIYPQQMATNATSGGQFQKPAYNSGYGTSGYDTLSQTGQDFNKNPYPSSGVGQQSKGQTVSNQQSTGGSGSDIAPSMYGKSHVALNKVNSYEKQSFHSNTPPPYNIAGTQNAGATSGQPYGQHLYIPTMPTHHNINNMHQVMHQDSNSSGQRPQSNSQGKTATKQGYSPSTYWTGQN
ncbi:protein lingerer isoform X3 [Uranotaenia lowii]|uniref:protein lingerer isoform X3 n=1 Tax=Uranotaenia lowii TaxID=190385 RepID=UPI00247841C6|nr:protein lingerer isoform X3 [Uranotaenia lowii]